MPILASKLMANRPLAEEEFKQVAELAASGEKRLSQQFAEIVASFMKTNFEPRYLPPPFIPPPAQRQPTLIVINLIVDLPAQE